MKWLAGWPVNPLSPKKVFQTKRANRQTGNGKTCNSIRLVHYVRNNLLRDEIEI